MDPVLWAKSLTRARFQGITVMGFGSLSGSGVIHLVSLQIVQADLDFIPDSVLTVKLDLR